MKSLILSLMMIFSLQAFAASGGSSVATNEYVDVNRFIGKWYAISDIPQFFSRKCLYQTAEYGIKSEKEISVKNTCYKGRKTQTIYGQAKVINPETNAELIVTFNTFWTRLFRVKGDYNIIKIDPNYEYVMVGGNNRSNLWIMSRSQEMPEEIYEEYVNLAKELGFNVHNLRRARFY
jgi:apolipoprotein D and lipocalin family protein